MLIRNYISIKRLGDSNFWILLNHFLELNFYLIILISLNLIICIYMRRLLSIEFESSFMYVVQAYIEKLLRKHGVISTKDFYLKLSLLQHPDLLIVKSDDMILVSNEDISFIFEFNNGQWFAKGYTYKGEDVIVSYYENGMRKVNPYTIKRFWILQKRFTMYIREQGWFENSIAVQNAIVEDIKLIEKNEPNPMRDISEYSDPRDK